MSVSKAQRAIAMLGASATAVLVSMGCYGEPAHAAPNLQVLTAFRHLKGSMPRGDLLLDSGGNVYGTTQNGGVDKHGVVFELSPSSGNKGWTETVLFSFNGTNGAAPFGALIADNSGNLYGTTTSGGAKNEGTVFELSPPAVGQTAWMETVLYSFSGGLDGSKPYAGLIADSAGNLYGTANSGGLGYGAVFEVSPPAAGQTAWTETGLYIFHGYDGGQQAPYPERLLLDGAGNLYGTTFTDSYHNSGVAFELSPPEDGQTNWTETVLLSFSDVIGPIGGLIEDGSGNFYGESFGGGANLDGSVYELKPPTAGKTRWGARVLYSFPGGTGGQAPWGKLLSDGKGHLYGTTAGGGAHNGGLVFELVKANGAWTEKTLYSFDGTTGDSPTAGLISDGAGNLYGTATFAGAHDGGTAFKLTH